MNNTLGINRKLSSSCSFLNRIPVRREIPENVKLRSDFKV